MKKINLFAAAICAATLFASCGSLPSIPKNASSTQLIQLGQDALETNNFEASEMYYNAVIQRYGTDTSKYIEANYELGHLYSKKKDYDKAYAKYSEILEIYEGAEYGSVPMAFKKLAQMGIDNLPAKYRKN